MCCIFQVVTNGKTYKWWDFGICMGSNHNARMLRYIAENARIVQEEFPDIVHDWVDRGISQKSIAKQRGLVGFLKLEGDDPDNIATSVVRMALYGLDNISERIGGFKGLVPRNVYDAVVDDHRKRTLELYNKNSPTSFMNMDKAALKRLSDKGVVARGRTPVNDEEKVFAYECSLDAKYITPQGVSWEKVLEKVNDRFHNNRSNSSVRHMAYEIKESKS